MTANLIGTRLKALREERKLTQDDLAGMFGFKDRQTVSAIENGERRLSASELLNAIEKLGTSLDYFTDPFLLAGEGRFSWRQSNVAQHRLDDFERTAGRWIAAHKVLGPRVGRPAPNLRRSLKLTSKSSFEDAMAAGERFTDDFELGPVPAANLVGVMERELGILVLMVDAIEGVSGAACRLTELDAVLINRREVSGRRNFDLAHELFHVLTWEAMPPEHVEDSVEQSRSRVEQLANNFASALLMPASVLERYGPWSGGIVERLNTAAHSLQVTATAMKWRLVALGWLTAAAAKQTPDVALRNNGRPLPPLSKTHLSTTISGIKGHGPSEGPGHLPPLFSRPFMEVVVLAIADGQLSTRRAADLLDLSLDELADLCATHGLKSIYAER